MGYLSPAENATGVDCTYPRNVKFRLGLSSVHATATLFDKAFPHVLRLSIIQRPLYGLFRSFVAWLPTSLREIARRHWPGAFLPARVALKQLIKPSYTETFENEISMYEKLRGLQGRIIPHFYGEAAFKDDGGGGTRAIVLSVVDGEVALKQTVPIPVDDFRQRLAAAHAEMLQAGIVYGDLKLSNLVLVNDADGSGGRLVFLDLEWAYALEPDLLEVRTYALIKGYVSRYEAFVANWERDRKR